MMISDAKISRRARWQHKAAVLLVGLALAFQVFMPFAQTVANGMMSRYGAETVVVCTSAGLVTYAVQPDGSFSEIPSDPAPSAPCEYCQVCKLAVNGAYAFTSVVPFLFAPSHLSSIASHPVIEPLNIQYLKGQQPLRGPPTLIRFG